jgi:para-nitrobenzyl esterase
MRLVALISLLSMGMLSIWMLPVRAFGAPAAASPILVDGGSIAGVREGDVTVYRGVPFAAPPVGELRWRAPQPVVPWTGTRIAGRASPTCLQRGFYPEDAPPEPMSEDCLHLNVWVPAGTAPTAKLPVMFWIHGGGLSMGSGSTPLYTGDVLARHGVIVVTANYRLGALGFLAHPELARESAENVSGNYGLLDQIAALRWVRRNIAGFGGDPGNVTVFGQSSGAIAISALSTSPLARGLFHRVIAQSGGLFEPIELAPEFASEGAEARGSAFATRLGAPSLAALRAKPGSDIVAAPFSPNPVIDGYVLHEPPYDAYRAGRMHDIDLLVGFNAGEGHDFIRGRDVTVATLPTVLRQDFPSFIVSAIGPDVPETDEEALAAFVAFETDMRFGWNMLAWARLHATSSRRGTYLYRFEHVPPGEAGARHGVEMAYIFGHADPDPPWTEADRRLSATMTRYWTNFAKTGNPNEDGLPLWPAFTPSREDALLIGSNARAGTLPNAADLTSIDRLYATVRFLLRNLTAVVAGALILAAALLALAWSAVRRRGTRPRTRRRAQP